MLKRRRPTTPPVPSVPLWEEPLPLDTAMMEREQKRRRTALVTDDPWGVWDTTPKPVVNQAGNAREGPEVSCVDSRYKSANSIIRELHTLHQHRLLFSTSATPPGHDTSGQSSSAPSSQSKANVSPSVERLTQAENPPAQTDPEQDHSCLGEQAQVKERYEEINRLLGSMFLSRRRQLGLEEPYTS